MVRLFRTMTEFYKKLFDIFKSIISDFNNSKQKYIRTKFGTTYDCLSLVFLCGGDLTKYDSRKKLSKIIKRDKKNKIILSEKLLELTGGLDLLSFEHLLEAISKAILIPVESFGTACELGAFTYATNCPKEIVIINKKHEHDNSFINDGPVKLLKENSPDCVCIAEYTNDDKSLVINKNINELNKHRLLNEPITLHKYFAYEGDSLLIKDLGTFLFSILDLCYFVGYCNSKIAANYFCIIHSKKRIVLDCSGFNKEERKVSKLIQSFFLVMENIGVLKRADDFWLPNAKSDFNKKQTGSLLFKKAFLNTEKYGNYFISFRNLRKTL